MNIGKELAPLIIEWINQHPKYGLLDSALKHRGICHNVITIDSQGLVHKINVVGHDKGLNCVDPSFFDKISEILDKHISGCNICKDLI